MAPSFARHAPLAGLVAVGVAVLPFAGSDLGRSPAVAGAVLGAAAVCALVTAALLLQRFLARGTSPLLGLAGAYFLVALLGAWVVIAWPGAPRAAEWLAVPARAGLAAALAAALWGGPRALRVMLAEPTLRRGRVAGLAAGGVAAVVAAVAWGLIAGAHGLPALRDAAGRTGLGLAVDVATVLIQAGALVVVARRGRRGDLERPLTTVVVAALAGSAVAVAGDAPWSAGWYAAFGFDLVASSVLLAGLVTEVGRLHRRLLLAADRAGGPRPDALTGTRTRGATVAAAEHLHSTRLPGTPVALALLDVDDLGALRHRYGPLAADAILVTVARRLQVELRDEDVLGRGGDDGFMVVLPGTDALGATLALDRAVAAVRAEPVGTWARHVAATASAGLAMVGEGEHAVAHALAAADLALKQAKANGRDRLVSPARGQLVELRRGDAGPRPG